MDGKEHVLGGELGVGPSGKERGIRTSLIPDVTRSPSLGVSVGRESGAMSFQVMCDQLMMKLGAQIEKQINENNEISGAQ